MTKIIVILTTLMAGMAFGEYCEADSKKIHAEYNCGKYVEDWRVSACASTLRQQNLISRYTYIQYLDLAKAKGGAYVTHYSIGFTTGLETKIVAGTIKDPVFDKEYSLNVEPSKLYFEKVLIDLGATFDKPVALFSINEIKGIPLWSKAAMSSWQPHGDQEVHTIFRSEKSGVLTLDAASKCNEFTRWTNENMAQPKKGVAILMGNDYWCPAVSSGVMEVVVAETMVIENNGKKLIVVKHGVWKNGQFGNPSPLLKTVFH